MGYDIYGLKPKTPKGEYFQRAVGTWPPLWRFVRETCPFPIPNFEKGFVNEGQEYSEGIAQEIAKSLFHFLQTGATPKMDHSPTPTITAVNQFLPGMAYSSMQKDNDYWLNGIRKFAEFCQDSGGFRIS